MIGEVGLDALITRSHPSFARCPTRWTYLAVFFEELYAIDRAQQLIHITTQGKVVDQGMPAYAVRVDQKRATSSEATVGVDYIVILRHLLRRIRQQRVLDRTNTTIVDRSITPTSMGLRLIHRYAQDLDATLFKLTDTVVKSDKLRGSNEGKILWIEKQRHIFASVI